MIGFKVGPMFVGGHPVRGTTNGIAGVITGMLIASYLIIRMFVVSILFVLWLLYAIGCGIHRMVTARKRRKIVKRLAQPPTGKPVVI